MAVSPLQPHSTAQLHICQYAQLSILECDPLAGYTVEDNSMGKREEMEQSYLTKSAALGVISAEAGCGRPTAEKAIKELQASGEIAILQAGSSHTQLIARADVAKVVAHIKSKQK